MVTWHATSRVGRDEKICFCMDRENTFFQPLPLYERVFNFLYPFLQGVAGTPGKNGFPVYYFLFSFLCHFIIIIIIICLLLFHSFYLHSLSHTPLSHVVMLFYTRARKRRLNHVFFFFFFVN